MAEPPSSSSSSSFGVNDPGGVVKPEKIPSFQLIDENGDFLPDALSNLMVPQAFEDNPRPWLSIVGLQNSGKSTLLKKVFGTMFEVLKPGVGVQQTTKGIWASNVPEALILDVAGTDNIIAGKEGKKLEDKLLLFSFVMSSVIIFNIKQESIGNLTGSCMKIFQEILEYKLKIFPQIDEKKVLLFCIRDYDDRSSKETLVIQLCDAINVIWDTIKEKQEFSEHSSKSINDLFILRFEVVFHARYCKDKFKEDTKRIRQSFPAYLEMAPVSKLTSSSNLVGDPAPAPAPALALAPAPASSTTVHDVVQGIWKHIQESPLISIDDIDAVIGSSFQHGKLEIEAKIELEELMRGKTDPLKDPQFQQSYSGILQTKLNQYDQACSKYSPGPRNRSKRNLLRSMHLHFLTHVAWKEVTYRTQEGFKDPSTYFWVKIRADRCDVNDVVVHYFKMFVDPLLEFDPNLAREIKMRSKNFVNHLFSHLVFLHASNVCFNFDSKFGETPWYHFITFKFFVKIEEKYGESCKHVMNLIKHSADYKMNSDEIVNLMDSDLVLKYVNKLMNHANAKKRGRE